ncbi:MAG: YceD family protein [Gammaproteobacteria bacterium]|nr:MAG: YceD family protein [Gammaproteobacteria bacterium]
MLPDLVAAPRLAEMAAQGEGLSGTLRVDELPRLSALVAHEPAASTLPLQFAVGFRAGAQRRPVVHVEVHGVLSLICQRCLMPVSWRLDSDVTLTAIDDDASAADLASPFDSVVLDENGALPLRSAVEDEILAVLPLAPLHADPAACREATTSAGDGSAGTEARTIRPFANLAEMMRSTDGGEI